MHSAFCLKDNGRIGLNLHFKSDVKSGLSLPRKSVVRLTDRPDMTLNFYRGRKTTTTQQQQISTLYLYGVVGWCDGAG